MNGFSIPNIHPPPDIPFLRPLHCAVMIAFHTTECLLTLSDNPIISQLFIISSHWFWFWDFVCTVFSFCAHPVFLIPRYIAAITITATTNTNTHHQTIVYFDNNRADVAHGNEKCSQHLGSRFKIATRWSRKLVGLTLFLGEPGSFGLSEKVKNIIVNSVECNLFLKMPGIL